ncbi:MAG: tau 95 subunit of transcription factor TFIIIC [Peltula sp. TS41687]|nr:MAG: tau 95 subunit of transcription factor TFIIIC [Peltula sp. TS41687]
MTTLNWIPEPTLQHLTGNQPYRTGREGIAQWHQVPDTTIVAVEHPFIIENIEEGLKTLGGDGAISRVVATKGREASLELYTRPDDPMRNGVMSHVVKTNDVLLKITVPKRTGRKRKRGSSGPYQADEEVGQSMRSSLSRQSDPESLLRSLRDNPAKYKVEPVGKMQRSYRYRALADIQYSTMNGSFMKRLGDSILEYDYDKIKRFKLDESKGVKVNTEVVPPPVTSRLPVPFNYSYLQNPSVKVDLDASGVATVTNVSTTVKILTQMVTHSVSTVPNEPPPEICPLEELDDDFQQIVHQVRQYLKLRPVWTRRALTNVMDIPIGTLRAAWQYAGYMFRSGPWREAIIRFGVDPRSDPKYRFYQTMMFQLLLDDRDPDNDKRKWMEERTKFQRANRGKQRDLESHVFDGHKVSLDGKVWQLCDITDPILRIIMETKNIRSTCDNRNDGWLHNGTMAKLRGIMKEKVRTIFNGNLHSDEDYNKFAAIPDVIDENIRQQISMPRVSAQWEIELAAHIRVNAMAWESRARTESRRDTWLKKSLKSGKKRDGETESEGEGEDDDDDDDVLQDGEEDEDDDGGNDSEETDGNDDDDDEDDDVGVITGIRRGTGRRRR